MATQGSRIVNLSSLGHLQGKMNFDDLDFEARGYKPTAAYNQSKLANLLPSSSHAASSSAGPK